MQTVRSKIIHFFVASAGVLLLSLAAAMIIGNLCSSGFTQPHDQVLLFPVQYLFWMVSATELATSLLCFLGEKISLKLTVVFVLAANFWVYRLAHHNGLSGYLGSLADAFGISPQAVQLILEITYLYLLIGSLCSLIFQEQIHITNSKIKVV